MGLIRNILRIFGRIYIFFKYIHTESWRKDYALRRLKELTGKKYKREFKQEFKEMFYNSEIRNRNYFIYSFDYLLSWIFLGAIPRDYFAYSFFDLPWVERRKHITQTDLTFINRLLNEADSKEILDNKAKFNHFYNDFINRKWCVPSEIDKRQFLILFKDVEKIIVKRQIGLGGHDINIYSFSDMSQSNVFDKISQSKIPLVAEEVVVQRGLLHEFNPSSVNTIRVTTVRVNQDVYICHAYLRVGHKGAFVDNVSSGGIRFLVDKDKGLVLSGSTFQQFNIENHPDTGIRITGHIIPFWKEIKSFVKRAHLASPLGLRLIGWDVCLSDSEISLIEGNTGPGFPPISSTHDNHWQKLVSYMDTVFPE